MNIIGIIIVTVVWLISLICINNIGYNHGYHDAVTKHAFESEIAEKNQKEK